MIREPEWAGMAGLQDAGLRLDIHARAAPALVVERGKARAAGHFTPHRQLMALAQAVIPDLRVIDLN